MCSEASGRLLKVEAIEGLARAARQVFLEEICHRRAQVQRSVFTLTNGVSTIWIRKHLKFFVSEFS